LLAATTENTIPLTGMVVEGIMNRAIIEIGMRSTAVMKGIMFLMEKLITEDVNVTWLIVMDLVTTMIVVMRMVVIANDTL